MKFNLIRISIIKNRDFPNLQKIIKHDIKFKNKTLNEFKPSSGNFFHLTDFIL